MEKKNKLGYYLGSILIILGPLLFMMTYIFAIIFVGGTCPMCYGNHPAIPYLLYSAMICPILGIIIIGYTYILYKYKRRKEKTKV